MGNMSYCRFHNTNQDFNQCVEAVKELMDGDPDATLSKAELEAAKDLVGSALDLISLLQEVVDNETPLSEKHEILEGLDRLNEANGPQ